MHIGELTWLAQLYALCVLRVECIHFAYSIGTILLSNLLVKVLCKW